MQVYLKDHGKGRFVWHSLSEHVQDRVVQLQLSGGGGGRVGQNGRVGGPQLVVHLGREEVREGWGEG